jgi:Trypsin
MQWPISVALAVLAVVRKFWNERFVKWDVYLKPALLLINAADSEKDVKLMAAITVPVLANPPIYTQAQLDSLQNELKPKLDFRFSEKGIIQRNVEVLRQNSIYKIIHISWFTTPAAENAGVVNNIQPLIIGGKDAELGQLPWQAILYFDNIFICGGSLIQPQWVLTASHCLTE